MALRSCGTTKNNSRASIGVISGPTEYTYSPTRLSTRHCSDARVPCLHTHCNPRLSPIKINPPAFSPLLFDSLQTKIPPPQKKTPANPHQKGPRRESQFYLDSSRRKVCLAALFLLAIPILFATCDAYCSFPEVDYALLSPIPSLLPAYPSRKASGPAPVLFFSCRSLFGLWGDLPQMLDESCALLIG